jgi:hypothetical protein
MPFSIHRFYNNTFLSRRIIANLKINNFNLEILPILMISHPQYFSNLHIINLHLNINLRYIIKLHQITNLQQTTNLSQIINPGHSIINIKFILMNHEI